MAPTFLRYPLIRVFQSPNSNPRETHLIPGYAGDWSTDTDYGLNYRADGCDWWLTDFEGWHDGPPVNVEKLPRLGGDGGFPLGRPSHPGRMWILRGAVTADTQAQALAAVERLAAHMANPLERGAFPSGTRIAVWESAAAPYKFIPVVADGGVKVRWLNPFAFEFEAPYKADDWRSFGTRALGEWHDVDELSNDETAFGGARWNYAIPVSAGTAPTLPRIQISWTELNDDHPDADLRILRGGWGDEDEIARIASGFLQRVEIGQAIVIDPRSRRVRIVADDDNPDTPTLGDARGMVTFPASSWAALEIPAQASTDLRFSCNGIMPDAMRVRVGFWDAFL